jgi:hypothetical protein
MNKINSTKIIGYVLLSPALLSVLLFIIDLLAESKLEIFNNLHYIWRGTVDYYGEGGGGGYSSALPLYFGLMAIAGSYLIKDK